MISLSDLTFDLNISLLYKWKAIERNSIKEIIKESDLNTIL